MPNDSRGDYSFTFFPPKTSPKAKKRGIFFTVFFSLLIIIQCCYWVIGNAALPIVLGMPFGMFVVVALIVVEFVALLALYFLESSENDQEVM